MMNHRRDLEKEQFWRLVVEEHSKSGLSAREFCRRESLSEPSFYSWRRKIRERDASTNGHSKRGLALIELVPNSNHDLAGIEMETPSGVKIRFEQPDAGQLSAVLAVIEGQSKQGNAPC